MSKSTVLVVDDEIGIRGLMQAILEDSDYRPLVAGTPSQALRLIEADPPDVAILDYMLPEMDGTELGRRLRDRFGERFPLIFMSAMDVPKSKLAELSSYLYISKPFDIDSVVEAIHSALAPAQPRPLKVPRLEAGQPAATSAQRRSALG
jgi:DNA-binding response OmpR family regulator